MEVTHQVVSIQLDIQRVFYHCRESSWETSDSLLQELLNWNGFVIFFEQQVHDLYKASYDFIKQWQSRLSISRLASEQHQLADGHLIGYLWKLLLVAGVPDAQELVPYYSVKIDEWLDYWYRNCLSCHLEAIKLVFVPVMYVIGDLMC